MRKWSPVILITVSFDEILLSGKLDRYCWKIQCTHLEFPKIEFLKLNERRIYIIYGYIHHHLNWHFPDCDHFSKQRSPVWKFSSALPWCLSPVRKIILKHFFCVPINTLLLRCLDVLKMKYLLRKEDCIYWIGGSYRGCKMILGHWKIIHFNDHQ